MKSCKILWVITAFLLTISVNAQDYPKKVTTVEGITEYELANGLKVLLFPDQSKQTITVNITYLVGSRHESYGETGMAHLLEHLVFKGTPNHPDIPKELSDHGASPNGTTWFDRTNYFEIFAATDENLRWALDLESDRMVNSHIAKKDLESEMTVVRNEYESGENYPSSVLYKRLLSTAYTWHNYGNTTIGARSDIENVPIDRLKAFYTKYYQPDNAVLLVAGKIDEEKTLELVNNYFGKIPKPERELIGTYTSEPTQDGERFVTLRRAGDIQAMAIMYHAAAGTHPDAAPIQLLLQSMTSAPSGRLYKKLVEAKKVSSLYGYLQSLREPGYIYFAADLQKDQSLSEAQDILLKTLDDLKDNPLTEEELNRAKAENLKFIELAQTNTERIGITMSEYIAMGDWRLFFINRDRIEKVSTDDIDRVAKIYFKPSNRTIGHFIPEESSDRVEIPKSPDITSIVDGYVGKKVMEAGEAFDPSPENIKARTVKGELSNGMRYSFLYKETKGNVVFVHMGIRFGDEKTLSGKRTVAYVAPALLNRGTSTKTRQEIQDLFDQYKAQVNFYGNAGKSFIRIQTTKENLENSLKLVLEILKDPLFPQDEFDTYIQQVIASTEKFKSEPSSKANAALSKYMNMFPEDHPNYSESPEETIENLRKLKVEDVRSFYKEYYGGGSGSTITIVGEFDEAMVKNILTNDLGKWGKGKPYERPPLKVFNGKPMKEEINTPDKANAVFMVRQGISMRDDDPEYPAFYVANYLLGGGFLNSRLATRIRQKEGLSYSVGSFLTVDGLEPSGTFGAQAIYNPENKDKLEKAFFEEIQKVIDSGFTQEELDAAKKAIMQSNTVGRAQDASLMVILNNNMMFHRDMEFYKKQDEAIQSLTLKQVNNAFRKYIKPEKFCVALAGDFEKGGD